MHTICGIVYILMQKLFLSMWWCMMSECAYKVLINLYYHDSSYKFYVTFHFLMHLISFWKFVCWHLWHPVHPKDLHSLHSSISYTSARWFYNHWESHTLFHTETFVLPVTGDPISGFWKSNSPFTLGLDHCYSHCEFLLLLWIAGLWIAGIWNLQMSAFIN